MKSFKIKNLQIDPNGLCNVRCWFCPVKYEGNPKETRKDMPFELFEKIIDNLIEEKNKPDGLVDPAFNGFYTSHYNEFLLYPHVEEVLALCRKHGLYTMILSNGTTLTPEKTDILAKYEDVLSGICLNVPGFTREVWSKRAGTNPKKFDELISNIKYAVEKLPNKVANNALSIQINGVHDKSFHENGGWMTKGPDFPKDLGDNELDEQHAEAKRLFPEVNIFTAPYLVDRAGMIDNVMSNKPSILKWLKQEDEEREVIGCNHGYEDGGRPWGWLHVNPLGETFLCCNDYNMEYKFGDFKTQELKDFWLSETHNAMIDKAFKNICKNCASAVYNKE